MFRASNFLHKKDPAAKLMSLVSDDGEEVGAAFGFGLSGIA